MSHVQKKIQFGFYVIHSYMHAFTFSVEKQYTNAMAVAVLPFMAVDFYYMLK